GRKVCNGTGLRESAFRGGHGARGLVASGCSGEHHLVLGGNRELRVDPQPFGLRRRGTGQKSLSRGLIVFVREALPGRVKTRLAGDLGVGAATELYAAMRADVLESASSLADVRLLVFWAVEQGALPVLQ